MRFVHSHDYSPAKRHGSGCSHAYPSRPMGRITAVENLVALLAKDRTMSSATANNNGSCFSTVAEVAGELNVSTKYVRRAIDRGDLPIYQFGRAIRIAPDDKEQFIRRHRASGPVEST
jgi:excisionase family DNA binding protein